MANKIFNKRMMAILLSLVMVFNLIGMGTFAAQTNEPVLTENFQDTYYKQNGTAGTASDWEIHLSKTATPTDEDNVFNITLSVETKDISTQLAGATHGAVALVLDVSSSMMEDTGACGTCGKVKNHEDHKGYHRVCEYKEVAHLDLLKKAVKNFLNSYAATAAEGEQRLVAIVKFATNADTVLSWIDVSNESNLATVKNAVDAMGSKSGTNIEAGLALGRNLLNMSQLNGIPLANQSLILFSDGDPTVAVGNKNNTSTTQVVSDGRGIGFSNRTSDDLAGILAGVNAKKKAVAYNTDAALLKSVFGAANVITSDMDSLDLDLVAEAGKIITSKTNASTVTDPMGTGVSMVTASSSYNNDNQKWDLSKFTPTVANGITTYTITYRVKLDPKAVPQDPNYPGYTVLTPANGATTLNYTYSENAVPVSVGFNEPNIRGINSFTVRYEYVGQAPAGAPKVPAAETYKAGQFVQVADAPALANYTFSGWSRNDFVMPAEDVVITGTWNENAKYPYSLTYNANFGTNETKADAENITGTYATSHNIEVDGNSFTRPNHTFTGWNTQADGKGKAYAAGEMVALTAQDNTEVLYAQWIENPKYAYSVTYNANFGANEIKADSENVADVYTEDYVITVDENSFDRDNYTFIGWSTSPEGEVVYQAGDKLNFHKGGQEELYAQWIEHDKYSYTVIYNGNGGALAEGDLSYGDSENVVGTYATAHSVKVDENSFDRAHYTFTGWNTQADGKGKSYAAEDVIALTAKDNTVTLYAQWTINAYDYKVVYMVRVDEGEYTAFAGQLPENAPTGGKADYGTEIRPEDLENVPQTLADDAYTYTFTKADGTRIGDGENVVVIYFTHVTPPAPPVEEPVTPPAPPADEPVTPPTPPVEEPITPPAPPVTEPATPPAPPLVELPDEEVPLASAPAEDLVELPDEEVPLADVPKTGDPLLAYLAVAVASGMGLLAVNRKKEEEE